MKLKGIFAAVFTILVWGITFVNTRALLREFSALEALVLRFFTGYAVLWMIWLFRREPAGRLVTGVRDELMFFLMGLSGVVISGWKRIR